MGFTNVKYEANSGQIYRCRLSDDKAAVAGAEPAGAATSALFAKLSKKDTEFGIRPRYVSLAREVGTAPDLFNKYTRLPVLTQSDFESATFAVGATITIGGITWTIIGQVNEDF